MPNKRKQADLDELSPFLQKAAKMLPSHPTRCCGRYVQLGGIMRLGLLLFITSLMTGCTSVMCTGYMDSYGTEGERHYSPYLELEKEFPEKGLLARLVISLEPSRIPKDYPQKDYLLSHCSDGIVPWVSEIYFINTSNDEIAIEPKSLQVGSDSKSFSGSATIEPQKWFITEPLLSAHSNYGTQTKASFEFLNNGNLIKVEGTAKRLTLEELKNKYSPK